ncbi:MAG: type II toxin-antitoxin system HicA family toxin [Cyanobacterium sp. T60_A2020_053]|nr:type II toxin-antitoxin system HicA family toxin [Cyanobacterium sp. T60_A2020_053]
MTGNEFVKKLKKLAKERGLECKTDQKRGKGSHVTLYFGSKFTILRNPKDELKKGTLNAMLNQLGLSQNDL